MIAFFATDLLYIMTGVVAAWALWKRKGAFRPSVVFLPAVFNWSVVLHAMRFFIHSARPFVALGIQPLVSVNKSEWYGSFPSGHAIFMFSLATSVWLYDKKLGWILYVMALATGVARVFAHVHWPVDIFVGAVLGIALTIAEVWAARKVAPGKSI